MNRLSLLFPALLVAGCGRSPETAVPQLASHTYTVREFIAQPELRKRALAFCANDPGRSALDPNCVNVIQAERMASFGTTPIKLDPH